MLTIPTYDMRRQPHGWGEVGGRLERHGGCGELCPDLEEQVRRNCLHQAGDFRLARASVQSARAAGQVLAPELVQPIRRWGRYLAYSGSS